MEAKDSCAEYLNSFHFKTTCLEHMSTVPLLEFVLSNPNQLWVTLEVMEVEM